MTPEERQRLEEAAAQGDETAKAALEQAASNPFTSRISDLQDKITRVREARPKRGVAGWTGLGLAGLGSAISAGAGGQGGGVDSILEREDAQKQETLKDLQERLKAIRGEAVREDSQQHASDMLNKNIEAQEKAAERRQAERMELIKYKNNIEGEKGLSRLDTLRVSQVNAGLRDKFNNKVKDQKLVLDRANTAILARKAQQDFWRRYHKAKSENTLTPEMELEAKSKDATTDHTMIIALAKILDPNSVVREGEYRIIDENFVAKMAKFGIKWKDIVNGQKQNLDESARINIMQRIEQEKKGAESVYNREAKGYNKLHNTSDAKSLVKPIEPWSDSEHFTTTSESYKQPEGESQFGTTRPEPTIELPKQGENISVDQLNILRSQVSNAKKAGYSEAQVQKFLRDKGVNNNLVTHLMNQFKGN